jgi:Na+/H+-dicarboxylate symporter
MAQALGMELSILQMAMIVVTATIAAAGAAGIPGAGMITLIIVLDTVHVPAAAIALIIAPDRILDMCRTVVNVAGDAVAAVVIAGAEEKSKAVIPSP